MAPATVMACSRLHGARTSGPRRADDLVFPNVTGGHLDPSALRRRFKVAHDRAGLKPVRFPNLRLTGQKRKTLIPTRLGG